MSLVEPIAPVTETLPPPAEAHPYLGVAHGSAAYWRINFALFLAGFSTFSLLYCVQPLFPQFTRDFHISAGGSALALSLATAALAVSIVMAAIASQSVQRRGLMATSLVLSAAFNFAIAFSPNWPTLLALRLLGGLALGGVPAVALAYLAEEIRAEDLGKTVGLYIGGTAFGGVMGRLGMGFLTEFMPWRDAIAVLGAFSLATACGFAWLLPPSRNFKPQLMQGLGRHLSIWGAQLQEPRLLRLFVAGFLLLSLYATTFNYIAFRLVAEPFAFSQAQLGALYIVALLGIFASSLAGNIADRVGKWAPMITGFVIAGAGITVSLSGRLPLIIAGLGLINVGFFMSHSVATGWVSSLAGGHKSHAASLYMLFYYTGSTVTGVVGGVFWGHGAWPAVAGLLYGLVALGLLLTWFQRPPANA